MTRINPTLVRAGAGILALVVVVTLIYLLESVVTILLVALFFAYLINPIVNFLSNHGVGRSIAASLLIVAGFACLISLVLFFVPLIFAELSSFIKLLPNYILRLETQAFAMAEMFNIKIPSDIQELGALISERGREILPKAAQQIGSVLTSIFTSTLKFVATIIYLLIIPVLTYYISVSFENIKRGVYDLIPPYARDVTVAKVKEIDRTISGFIRGQLIVCTFLAIFYSIGFMLIGIDLAILLGTLGGILFVIPYAGTIFAVLSGSIMALARFGDVTHVFYVIGWIGVVQLFESYVLTPRVVGEVIGLHPVIYILALIVGGNLFGFVGILVAVPVTAVLKIFLMSALQAYRNSYLYKDVPEPK
jgi:predicted PurR-regulated permease PerM